MSRSTETPRGRRHRWRLSNKATVLAVIVAAALVLGALAGYLLGVRHGERTNVMTGDFYVGAHQATAPVDGWSYGIADGVAWVDSTGSLHQKGWPECLAKEGTTVRVTFGEVPATGPQGISWRQVVWVDCRGATTR